VVKPVEPSVWHPAQPQQADSLTPMLRWEPLEDGNATYDVIVYKAAKVGPSWAYELTPGQEVYYAQAVQGTAHRVTEQLEGDTPYFWAVRVRKDQSPGGWSSYDWSAGIPYVSGNWGSGYLFGFRTPKTSPD